MADKFISKDGFIRIWSKIKNKIDAKQDTLVSGTNIKTVGGSTLLGSGDVNVASLSHTPNTFKVEDANTNIDFTQTSTGMTIDGEDDQGTSVCYAELTSKTYVEQKILEGLEQEATETTAGTIKLNPNQAITLNANGQLEVGGRLGQFPNGGVFYSEDRAPRNVGENTFLITDALGMNAPASRSFAILTGLNVNFTGSHAAGSTTYTVKNTFLNRLMCAGIKYLSVDEATSKVTRVTEVTSVTINGAAFTPTSAADSTTPIVITCAESANPTKAVTVLRAFRKLDGYGSVVVGNGAGQDAGGLNIVIGQHAYNKTGNMNTVLGQYQYNQGNGNALFGRYHISMKNRWFLAGTGHDNTSGRSEAGAAVGQYSRIDANTLFAVGNGTSHTARQNAFEVVDGGIVLLSPNSTRFKITVDNNGILSTTAL